MKVLKFGGTSVGSPEALRRVLNITERSIQNNESPVLVVSAFQTVTNRLISCGALASERNGLYREHVEEVISLHQTIIASLLGGRTTDAFNSAFSLLTDELNNITYGIYLLGELSPKSSDVLLSLGERFSSLIIAEFFSLAGIPAVALDTRTVIKSDSTFGNARVLMHESTPLIREKLQHETRLTIAAGFIASTLKGETTTLGRGGSDYTASVLGAALQADEVQIWTDVDGVLTADPHRVKKAISIAEMSYGEALEMSHFGAKVIYPPTIKPAMTASIPIRILNTFRPDFEGTLISQHGANTGYPLTGITTTEAIALIKIEGTGVLDVAVISTRIFNKMAYASVPILLISQACSGNSICFAVQSNHADQTKELIESELKHEFAGSFLQGIVVDKDVSIVTVVGDNIRTVSGVAGKLLQTLARNGIETEAAALGSSKRNISLVVKRSTVTKALNAFHDTFFLSDYKTVNLFVAGTGAIGRTLFMQIKNQAAFLFEELKLVIKIVGITNTRNMVINTEGIGVEQWEEVLIEQGRPADSNAYMEQVRTVNLPNKVFVDCTSSEAVMLQYPALLASAVSVVTPNKKANSGRYDYYLQLRKTALKHNVHFLYETNVGAGLPVISVLHDLVLSGDKILSIEGVLSGTLSYVFNTFDQHVPFSQALKDAHGRGYTESDPREDLRGTDVARKLLILVREAGYQLEFEDITLEPLLPAQTDLRGNIEEFFAQLPAVDSYFESKRVAAESKGKRLRYIASFKDGKSSVSLQEVGHEHPFYSLASNDNILSFKTVYYYDRPMVIQGPGAGAKVTSGGILADIVRISNNSF